MCYSILTKQTSKSPLESFECDSFTDARAIAKYCQSKRYYTIMIRDNVNNTVDTINICKVEQRHITL